MSARSLADQHEARALQPCHCVHAIVIVQLCGLLYLLDGMLYTQTQTSLFCTRTVFIGIERTWLKS